MCIINASVRFVNLSCVRLPAAQGGCRGGKPYRFLQHVVPSVLLEAAYTQGVPSLRHVEHWTSKRGLSVAYLSVSLVNPQNHP